jgi:membrane protein required for colicin V production
VTAAEPVDILVMAILGIAMLRGISRGLIREAFSIAALAGACLFVKLFAIPLGARLEIETDGQIAGWASPWLAGAILSVAAIAAIATVGRFVRRGSRWVGLGWADRAGGAVLGAAEGGLIVAILLVTATVLLGREHPSLSESRSFAVLERIEQIAQSPDSGTRDVAASPP